MNSKKENDKHSDEIELVLLKTINNDFELSLIKNLLDDNQIPYLVKDYGIGGYMRIITASSMFRTDILVEISSYEKAKEIIDEFIWNE